MQPISEAPPTTTLHAGGDESGAPAVRVTSPPLEVSVVLPCLDEAETLAACIHKTLTAFKVHGIAGEIVVADNGSTDGSAEIASGLRARVVKVESRGYGSALLGGIQAARGRYVVMADADGSYDLGEIPRFVEKLREGYDLVMGNRFRGAIRPGAMPFLHRYLGNPVLSGIGRLFFRSPCGDFHCGIRAFRKDAILALDLRTTGMEFASELVVKASLHDLRIAEVPVTLSPDGRSHPPHLRTWRDGWRHLRFLLMYSPRWLFLYPGMALSVLGISAGLWLLPGPRTIGGVTLDVHSLLYAAAMVVIGFQAVSFAVFAKVFAITEGLLPEDPRLTRLFRRVPLEAGLAAGALLLALGFALSIAALGSWESRAFGDLEPARMLRLVVPGVTSLVLGFQAILSSFFLSILGMRRR